MSELHTPELLAPAGDYERFTAAVLYGADAVYLGAKELGMRAASQNFTFEELSLAVQFAHSRNVRVYLTCNTLPTNKEAEELPEFMRNAKACGVDALIVADIGVLMEAKRIVPDLDVHISTQAGVVNYLTARELYEMGASRVVLARELSLEDIRIIRDKTPGKLEIECFVHGAMCMSFSGRCLLSSYLTGRDANRGECAQPCRWGYYLMEEKRPGQYFKIFEDEKGSYILNAKDMCMIEHIDKLADAGISSFKIEGRAKSSYYVSVITNAYRCAIDSLLQNPMDFKLPQWVIDEVYKVSHRQYIPGFYFGRPEEGQCYETGGYIRSFDVIGVVDGYEDGFLLCTQRNRFFKGDEIEILQPKTPPIFYKVDILLGESDEEIEAANKATMKFKIPFERPLLTGSLLRKEKNNLKNENSLYLP